MIPILGRPYFFHPVLNGSPVSQIDIPVAPWMRSVVIDGYFKCTGSEHVYSLGGQFKKRGASSFITTGVYTWSDYRTDNNGGSPIMIPRCGGNGSEVRMAVGIIPGSLTGSDANHLAHVRAVFTCLNEQLPIKPGCTSIFRSTSSNSINSPETGGAIGTCEEVGPFDAIRLIVDDSQSIIYPSRLWAYGEL